MTNQLIYTGKAKDIYTTEDEHVIKSVYKDQATMLNGARKETIKGKGCSLIPTPPDDEQSPGIFHLQEDFE